MEDDLNGRQPQWKTTSIEDDHNGRQPQWKTTSMEDDLNGRRLQCISLTSTGEGQTSSESKVIFD